MVAPSDALKENINSVLKETEQNLNLYLWEDGDSIEWLIEVANSVNSILLDIDNFDHKWLIGYFLMKEATYYLTSSQDSLYNVINTKRVYDAQQFKEGENNFEKKIRQ
jgi:hypothetical protein